MILKPIIAYRADDGVARPLRGSAGAAAWDIAAAEDAALKPYVAARISSGIRARIPEGHCLLILSRSGFSFKNQIIIPNSVGVIDEDYRGIIGLGMMWAPSPLDVIELAEVFGTPPDGFSRLNHEKHERTHLRLRYREDAVFKVRRGDRIAQALLIPYVEQEWRQFDALPETARGENGFGSTGLRVEDAVGSAIDPVSDN